MFTERNLMRNTITGLSWLGAMVTVAFCVYCYRAGVFTTPDVLYRMLGRAGLAAPVIFILLQIVQVVVPVIPGAAGCVAGVLIFGPWYGFLYNYIGICIGSVFNFLIAKRFGRPFVQAMVKEDTYDKYIGWLDKGNRFTALFATAIFLPVAPDDFLCMLAGLTKMELSTFVVIILLGKPLSIFAYSTTVAVGARWAMSMLGG